MCVQYWICKWECKNCLHKRCKLKCQKCFGLLPMSVLFKCECNDSELRSIHIMPWLAEISFHFFFGKILTKFWQFFGLHFSWKWIGSKIELCFCKNKIGFLNILFKTWKSIFRNVVSWVMEQFFFFQHYFFCFENILKVWWHSNASVRLMRFRKSDKNKNF